MGFVRWATDFTRLVNGFSPQLVLGHWGAFILTLRWALPLSVLSSQTEPRVYRFGRRVVRENCPEVPLPPFLPCFSLTLSQGPGPNGVRPRVGRWQASYVRLPRSRVRYSKCTFWVPFVCPPASLPSSDGLFPFVTGFFLHKAPADIWNKHSHYDTLAFYIVIFGVSVC